MLKFDTYFDKDKQISWSDFRYTIYAKIIEMVSLDDRGPLEQFFNPREEDHSPLFIILHRKDYDYLWN